jgi:hypothetical protein
LASPPHRIGLVASERLRTGPDAPRLRFMAAFRRCFVAPLRAEVHVVGATYDALAAVGY